MQFSNMNKAKNSHIVLKELRNAVDAWFCASVYLIMKEDVRHN